MIKKPDSTSLALGAVVVLGQALSGLAAVPPWLALALSCLLAGFHPGMAGAQPFAHQQAVHARFTIGEAVQGVRFLGALKLPSTAIDGLPAVELSGLAFSPDSGILFAVSDHGNLFSYRPIFEDGVLVDVQPLHGVRLRDAAGIRLRGKWSDSEGLDIINGDNGDTADDRLLVSFERRPRIALYAPSGELSKTLRLPAPLSNRQAYTSANKGLEAVAAHTEFGFITAPEWPLRGADPGAIPLFSQQAAIGLFARNKEPAGAIVAIENLGQGDLLVLERAFSRSAGHLVVNLDRIRMPTPGKPSHELSTSRVLRLDSARDWFLDNFEGLSRHRDARFFMISDDNESFFQNTLLWYFELLD